jgi:phage/plasmid-associated DNA primase
MDWLEECCRRTEDKNDKVTSTELYRNYKRWCVDNGEEWLSQKMFSKKLESLGLEKGLERNIAVFKDIKLLNPTSSPDEGTDKYNTIPPRQPPPFANKLDGGGAVGSPPTAPDSNGGLLDNIDADEEMDYFRNWQGRDERLCEGCEPL